MRLRFVLIGCVLAAFPVSAQIIVDHTCTHIAAVPQEWIEQAKANLRIVYGHTSHGSQLVTGMSGLVGFMNGLGYPTDLYAFNGTGEGGALELHDAPFSNAFDLGNPDYTAWEPDTRSYLSAHPEINVVIWSWCGEVSWATETDISTYLSLMDGLEHDFPGVKFVYMTGHLDGGGLAGNLHLRNQQIRDYCQANGKTLFDFEDIESYNPDGVYFGDQFPTDGCNYDANDDGTTEQTGDPATPLNGDVNWALEWQGTHTEGVDWFNCSPAHTQALNGNLKAYAAWWLWARLAGWTGSSEAPRCTRIVPITFSPTPESTVSFAVEFSGDVVNFDGLGDVIVTQTGDASHTGVTISGGPSEYRVDITGVSGTGNISIAVSTASDVRDGSGNGLTSSVTSVAIAVDPNAPALPAPAWPVAVVLVGAGLVALHRRRAALRVRA